MMIKEAAPAKILTTITCGCKTGCGKACGCRKSGLSCTIACKVCRGSKCTNNTDDYADDCSENDDIDENEYEYEDEVANDDANECDGYDY